MTSLTPGDRAEALIAQLGITRPAEIDVEAIALDANLEVAYEPLRGCEASLVGFRERAIATVRRSGNRGRERFSIGHELGHWLLHRGRSFRCRVDGPEQNFVSDAPLEKEADEFASHLLLPRPFFYPVILDIRTPDFSHLQEIARTFETSLMATALRLVKVDALPVILACYGEEGRRWFAMAPHIPKRWWLKNELDEATFAFELLKNGAECRTLRKQPADAWFDNHDAENFEVLEQCFPTVRRGVLVLLYLTDVDMFDCGFDPTVGVRPVRTQSSGR